MMTRAGLCQLSYGTGGSKFPSSKFLRPHLKTDVGREPSCINCITKPMIQHLNSEVSISTAFDDV
jgi:hypothetical protein